MRTEMIAGEFGERRSISGATMGTRFSAVIFPPPDVDLDRLLLELQTAVDAVDDQMSTWKPNSQLMRFNALPVGAWFDLPLQLEAVLSAAFEIGRLSSDAFDIGVGDVVAAWGFGHAGGVVDREAIRAAAARKPAPARVTVELDRQRHRARKREATTLDLSGIAKGYGVDELARVVAANNIRHYLVSLDGEVRAACGKPDGTPWRVAVEAPARGRRKAAGIIELRDGALATSGSYRQLAILDGTEHSHTMDPRRRRPSEGAAASVTVGAPTCMEADAWATALTVMGQEQGAILAGSLGLDVLFAAAEP